MSNFLRKRYLDDVLINESRQEKRSHSTTLIANLTDNATITTNPLNDSLTDQDRKEHFNITMDLLAFRKLAILSCQNLTRAISDDIEPFFSKTKDAVNFIHNLDSNWAFTWKQHVLLIEEEIKRLGDKYAFKQALYEEDWSEVEEPSIQVPSDDDNESAEVIPSSRLREMRDLLDKPESLPNLLNTPSTSQKELNVRQISSKLSLRPNIDKCPGSEESAVFAEGINNMLQQFENAVGEDTKLEDDGLNEVPDYDSLSIESISLNLSESSNPGIIPKASVLRMIVKDSQDNQHIVSKHYVQTEECHVCMSIKEKKLVDEFQRKREISLRSRESDDSNSSGSDEQPRRLRNKKRKAPRFSSSDSSSSADSYEAPSYSGSSNDSDSSGNNDRTYDDYSHYSDSTESLKHDELDDIPDEYSEEYSEDTSASSDSERTKRRIKQSREKRETDTDVKKEEDTTDTSDDEVNGNGDSEWRKDPLLKRIRVNVHVGSETDSVKSETEPEGKIETETESDNEPGPSSAKRLKLSLSPNKSKRFAMYDTDEDDPITPDTSLNKSLSKPLPKSDEDSDVEFISTSASVPVKGDDSPSKKGRRNIKSILSEESLNATTRAAHEEEKERIKRLQAKAARFSQLTQLSQSQMSTVSSTSADSEFVLDENTDHPIVVHNHLARRLYPHQRAGIQFLWDNCYESVERLQQGDKGAGCILAHCMGLGKTFQVVALVHTLFKYPVTNTKRVLVICPITTILNWRKEFRHALRLANKVSIEVFHCGSSQTPFETRCREVCSWFRRGGVLIIGYQSFVALVKRELKELNEALLNPGPDLVVCDEGHLLKSGGSTRTKIISEVATKRRIILTGTPMQNNLEEYYFMVGFVKPKYLGTKTEYRNRFVNPIKNGQFEDSTQADIQRMRKRSHVLHKMTMNFIQRFEESELAQHLPQKFEYALKIQMCDLQINLLNKFLKVCNIKDLFANVHVIRGVCTHPYLLKMQADAKEQHQGKKPSTDDAELQKTLKQVREVVDALPPDAATNIAYGPKLVVMMSIIRETMARHEKLLIFSSSLLELDLIEQYLKQDAGGGWCAGKTYYRIDGGVPNSARETYTRNFNTANSIIKLMLLTHKVGGLGLNLHAANRAIIMDVSWNPADDTQSEFRIYRIGQENTCYIYRLIAMGTTEEVIYERSVTKQAIAGRVVDEMQISRHFQEKDLEAMYRCKMQDYTVRPMPKLPKDTLLANLLQEQSVIYSYQDHKELLQNLPHEELNEAEMTLAWEEYEREKNCVPPPQPIIPPMPFPDLTPLPPLPFMEELLNTDTSRKLPVPVPSTAGPTMPTPTNMPTIRQQFIPAILRHSTSTLNVAPGPFRPSPSIYGAATNAGFTPASFANVASISKTSSNNAPVIIPMNLSNIRTNVRPTPSSSGAALGQYIPSSVSRDPRIYRTIDNVAQSSSQFVFNPPAGPVGRHSVTKLPVSAHNGTSGNAVNNVSKFVTSVSRHPVPTTSTLAYNATIGNAANNVSKFATTVSRHPVPTTSTSAYNGTIGNAANSASKLVPAISSHTVPTTSTLAYNMASMVNAALHKPAQVRPNLKNAVPSKSATAVKPNNTPNPWQYKPTSRVNHMKGKTFLFESPATRGGKVLVQFDKEGKVINNRLQDQLTDVQINMAESLPNMTLQNLDPKMFVISQDGVLRPLETNVPKKPSAPSSNMRLEKCLKPPSKLPPKITASIIIEDDDVDDQGVIEIPDTS